MSNMMSEHEDGGNGGEHVEMLKKCIRTPLSTRQKTLYTHPKALAMMSICTESD